MGLLTTVEKGAQLTSALLSGMVCEGVCEYIHRYVSQCFVAVKDNVSPFTKILGKLLTKIFERIFNHRDIQLNYLLILKISARILYHQAH